ncbi:MAG: hypothetical protein JW967_07990 [Dehalococcoidales bacterium]|nr:hypothetical protein [Dehalococcoidales bacterium]
MIELPEAVSLAKQLDETISGKQIAGAIVGQTPHKLAWYYGDPSKYAGILKGRVIGKAGPYGGLVEIKAGSTNILIGEGVNLRFHRNNEPRPAKHQL